MNNVYVLKYDTENLGDDVQSVATTDILDEMGIFYEYVYRDLINGYYFDADYKNYIIFNGWFSNGYGLDIYYRHGHEDRNNIEVSWPPKGNFIPILYSFHISEWGPRDDRQVHPAFLEKSLDFYKSAGSIGCRDSNTLNILQKLGVNSYLSGCITLSLDKNKYSKKNINKNKVLFVDIPEIYKEVLIDKTASYFHETLSFKTMSHTISPCSIDIVDRLVLAKRHLGEFCNAKLVFTTRLHVALPCLAFGTPVIFMADENELNNHRYVDYLQHLNVLIYNKVADFNLEDYLSEKYDRQTSSYIKHQFINIMDKIIQ